MRTGKDKSNRYFLTSVTRITDFAEREININALSRRQWRMAIILPVKVTGTPVPVCY